MIVITDYKAGNIKSITNILDTFDEKYVVSADKKDILSADAIIFPGQGHFGQAVEKLSQFGLIETLKETACEKKIKFLGICLGLQILFEKSEEAKNAKGLGFFEGEVVKFKDCKIPQIGWNNIITTDNNSYLPQDYFYFVNSYYAVPKNPLIISSFADYGGVKFCASIEHENITAVQFHPEKSANAGRKFFQNWLEKI